MFWQGSAGTRSHTFSDKEIMKQEHPWRTLPPAVWHKRQLNKNSREEMIDGDYRPGENAVTVLTEPGLE